MAGKDKDEELEEELEDEEVDAKDDDDDDDEGEESKENKGASDGGKSKPAQRKGGKTFNQKQVSKMMANEKRQGKASAFNALGIDADDTDTINAVKAFINERKQAQAASAKNDEAADDGELSEFQERAMMAEAKVDAMVLGCQPKYVDDVVTLALAKAADDGSDFKTVVGELKTKYPDWFTGAETDEDKGGKKKSGTGGSPKKGAKRSKSDGGEESLGARLAAQRVAKNGQPKKSYWS